MIPHLTADVISRQDLALLGQEYVREVQAVDSGRTQLLADYQQFIRNYEGDVKPTEREKPWDGASEAHVDKSATDTDITFARGMNAVFGQFPAFMIRPLSAKWVEWTRETQRFSEWLEEVELPLYDLFAEALLVTTKFGTSVIYVPWEDHFVNTYSLDANDEWIKTHENELGRPTPRVIHPENFLLPIHSTDTQRAPWCGYRYKLRPAQLKLWKKQGFFTEAEADQLLALFSAPNDVGHLLHPPGESREMGENLVQKTREETAGLTRSLVPDELDMIHIFARVDIDNDGVEEEVNFHLHEKTGLVPRITFTHYRHRRRPFIPLHFFKRDGVFYSIGILEMLKDTQLNLDVLMRQIQDNNTVKNTQAFVTDSGNIKPNEPFHPARIFRIKQGETFQALRMGDIQMSTTIENLNTVATWGERRTGVADPAMDVGDRTPATTTLALLQEASRRIDLIIGGWRKNLAEFWMQVLQLYAQFKPVVEFEVETEDNPEGVKKFDMFQWHAMSDVDFRKAIVIKPTVSTSALNKAIQRTELQALNETVMAYNQATVGILDLFLTAVDPSLKGFLRDTLVAQHRIMQRQVDTFEFAKDQGIVLPNPEKYLNAVSPLQPPIGPPGGAGGGPAGGVLARPQGLTPGPSGGLAPATAPGRPGSGAGVPRQPTGGRSSEATAARGR